MSQEQHNKGWRKKLSEQEAPLDIQQFWNNLEPQLPPQKKRRKMAWWIWPALLFIGIGLAALYYSTTSTEEEPQADLINTNQEQKADLPSIEENTNDLSDNRTEASISSTYTGNADDPGGQMEHGPAEKSGKQESMAQPKKAIQDPPENNADRPSGGIVHNEDLMSQAQSLQLAQQHKPQPDHSTDPSRGMHTSYGRVAESFLSLLPEMEIWLLDMAPVTLTSAALITSPSIAPPAWTWAISLAAGPGVGFRRLTSDDPASQAWIRQRNREESILESWQIRGMVEVLHSRGWLVETGIQWTRQNERLNWSKDSLNWAWGIGEGFLIDEGGGSQPWSDTTWNSRTLTRTVRHYNQMTTLEIPVGGGYQIHRGRWSARASIGALFNLRQWASGRSIHAAQWPVYWGDPGGSQLKSRLGIGAYGHARLSYRFLDEMNIFVQPSYTLYPGDRQEGSTYTLKYNQANLLLGLRWNLKED